MYYEVLINKLNTDLTLSPSKTLYVSGKRYPSSEFDSILLDFKKDLSVNNSFKCSVLKSNFLLSSFAISVRFQPSKIFISFTSGIPLASLFMIS